MTIKLLTTDEVADLLRTSPSTVRYWRYRQTGPRGIKRGRRVLYPEDEVLSWLSGTDEQPAGDVA